MKKRVMMSMMIIVLMAAMIGGATMAWFTDSATGGEATFTAGTVIIKSEGATIVEPTKANNWNPGDCDKVIWTFVNDGTKGIKIRFLPSATWGLVNEEGQFIENELSIENVDITLCEESILEGWTEIDGIYYYLDPIARGESVELCLKICLIGESTTDIYQGASFVIKGNVEAVQASHGAAEIIWELDPQ